MLTCATRLAACAWTLAPKIMVASAIAERIDFLMNPNPLRYPIPNYECLFEWYVNEITRRRLENAKAIVVKLTDSVHIVAATQLKLLTDS